MRATRFVAMLVIVVIGLVPAGFVGWHRIVPHNARLKGWTITPSHFLNSQLDTVWLVPE